MLEDGDGFLLEDGATGLLLESAAAGLPGRRRAPLPPDRAAAAAMKPDHAARRPLVSRARDHPRLGRPQRGGRGPRRRHRAPEFALGAARCRCRRSGLKFGATGDFPLSICSTRYDTAPRTVDWPGTRTGLGARSTYWVVSPEWAPVEARGRRDLSAPCTATGAGTVDGGRCVSLCVLSSPSLGHRIRRVGGRVDLITRRGARDAALHLQVCCLMPVRAPRAARGGPSGGTWALGHPVWQRAEPHNLGVPTQAVRG